MTDAWNAVMSEGREQSSLKKHGDYTEDHSSDDVYLEDISSYSIYILLHENCPLQVILISVRE